MSTKLDPRIKRTRELFENALIDLMDVKDFNKITVQEIASKSTLNRATFYLHYYDKEDLLQQCLESAVEELKQSIIIPETEFKYIYDEPHPTFIRLFEKMMERGKFYRIMLAEEKIPYFTTEVYKLILEFVEEGGRYLQEDDIKSVVPFKISRTYVASAYIGVIIWWLKQDMPYTPKYMASQLTIMSTVGPHEDNPFMRK